jgi:hypothetical protein
MRSAGGEELTVSVTAELKRRNVYRAVVFYAAADWLLVRVSTQVFPIFDVPVWVMRLVVVAVVVGFPFALGGMINALASTQGTAEQTRHSGFRWGDGEETCSDLP